MSRGGRVGEVWRAVWASYPEGLLLVVSVDLFWNRLTTLDLLTGETQDWLPSEFNTKRHVKVKLTRMRGLEIA